MKTLTPGTRDWQAQSVRKNRSHWERSSWRENLRPERAHGMEPGTWHPEGQLRNCGPETRVRLHTRILFRRSGFPQGQSQGRRLCCILLPESAESLLFSREEISVLVCQPGDSSLPDACDSRYPLFGDLLREGKHPVRHT